MELDPPFTRLGKELDTLQQAYEEGRQRFTEGWTLNQNPYRGEAREQWARGWYDIQRGINRTL